jgi:hypothetical protein
MKKCKKRVDATASPVQNPVAKFAYAFNKALIFRDKSKYSRNPKHRKQEASSVILMKITEKTSCFEVIFSC